MRTERTTEPPRAGTAEPGVIEEVETETSLARPWNVIVHDDPISLMTYVTVTFQRVFGYAYDKAHRLMMEVHNQGRSIVWTGGREQAELYVFKLHAAQLRATLEQVED
jgi:ATP-dependent Clp protease adaptor protein ClpS